MFNLWYKHGVGKSWFKNLEYSLCITLSYLWFMFFPGSKVHGANMGPIWGRQDLGGPHVGPMNFNIWELFWFWFSGHDFIQALPEFSDLRSSVTGGVPAQWACNPALYHAWISLGWIAEWGAKWVALTLMWHHSCGLVKCIIGYHAKAISRSNNSALFTPLGGIDLA